MGVDELAAACGAVHEVVAPRSWYPRGVLVSGVGRALISLAELVAAVSAVARSR